MFEINLNDAKKLTLWYQANKRSLPWRDTNNPYHVWISEIMLQQTRIEAVKIKYLNFIQQIPDIPALAVIEDDALMKLWEGLGYYSRARNLKKCAIELVEKHNSKLPTTYEALIKLPGIGPYTAGAIASISFHQPVPCVDGNVMRVLARLNADNQDIRNARVKKDISSTITKLFQQTNQNSFYSDFNQAIMELGETVCLPNGKPNCDSCPVSMSCKAHQMHQEDRYPYRSSIKARKIVNRTIFLIEDEEHLILHKRPMKGLLAGLYEFPGIDSFLSENEVKTYDALQHFHISSIERTKDAKHIFTHIEWHMIGYRILVNHIPDSTNYVRIKKKELQQYAIPSAFRSFLKEI